MIPEKGEDIMEEHRLRFEREETENLPSFYMLDVAENRLDFDVDEGIYHHEGTLEKGILRLFFEESGEKKECFYLMEDEKTLSSFRVIRPYEATKEKSGILYHIDKDTQLVYTGDDKKEKILMVLRQESEDKVLLTIRLIDFVDNYFENRRGYLSMMSPDIERGKNLPRKDEGCFFLGEDEGQEEQESSLQRSYLDSMMRENRR